MLDPVGLLCCLVAGLLYYNTLNAGFVYDDSRAIVSNQDVLPSTPLWRLLLDDFWGTPLSHSGSHGSYRPLCVLTFRLNYALGGLRPWGYHLVNALLHCLCTALVVRVARALFGLHALPVAAAGLLFAAHPVHTEAVAGVVGRAELVACAFYLLAFLCYAAHVRARDRHACRRCCGRFPEWAWLGACLLFAACALLAKETGATVLAVCAAYDVLVHLARWRGLPLHDVYTKRRGRSMLTSLCGLALALCSMLLLRLYLMGMKPPAFARADNPTARCPSLLTRTLTFLYLPVFNLGLLICPRWLSFDWSMDAIPRVQSLLDPRATVTLLVYYVIYRTTRAGIEKLYLPSKNSVHAQKQATYRKTSRHIHGRKQIHRFGGKPMFVDSNVDLIKTSSCPVCRHSLLDHSPVCRTNNNNNTIPMLGTTVAPCCCGVKKVPKPKRPPVRGAFSKWEILLIAMLFLAVPFLPATNLFFYVGFVVAERVLYIPSVGYCLLLALGCHVLQSRLGKTFVIVCLGVALVAFSVRTVQRNRDWFDEESLYRSGVPINPPKSYGNLGFVLSARGRVAEAEWAFRMALKYRSNMADVHYNLGNLLQSKEQLEEAARSYQLAIQYRPTLAVAHLSLGRLLEAQGRCEEAMAVYRRCWQLDDAGLRDPRAHHDARLSALLRLARLHHERRDVAAAAALYQEALDAAPDHYPTESVEAQLEEARQRLSQYRSRTAPRRPVPHQPHVLPKNKSRQPEGEQWLLHTRQMAPPVYPNFGSSQPSHDVAAKHQSDRSPT